MLIDFQKLGFRGWEERCCTSSCKPFSLVNSQHPYSLNTISFRGFAAEPEGLCHLKYSTGGHSKDNDIRSLHCGSSSSSSSM